MKILFVVGLLCCFDGSYAPVGVRPPPKKRKDFHYTKLKEQSSGCSYTGYPLAAGSDSKINIERITAPTAEMEGNILVAISGKGGATGRWIGSIAPLLEKGPLILKNFGFLGAGLGVFEATTKPSPADILRAANKAIAKLTDEVNDKFDAMKDYVDQSIIDLEKGLIARDYQELFTAWHLCGEQPEGQPTVKCQGQAWNSILSKKSSFLLNFASMNEWKNFPPEEKEVKTIEANIFNFKLYVNLACMVGKTLLDYYKDTTNNLEQRDHYVSLFKRQLSEIARDSIKYARKVKQLLIDTYNGVRGCEFKSGDGMGGSNIDIGEKPSVEECIKACREKKKTIPTINGVTIPNSNENTVSISCWCELGMKSWKSDSAWQSCLFDSDGHGGCKRDSMTCGTFHENVIKEWHLFSRHVSSSVTCSCKPNFNNANKCDVTTKKVVDGASHQVDDYPTGYKKYEEFQGKSEEYVTKEVAYRFLEKAAKPYVESLVKDVETYYENNIMALVPKWQDYIQEGEASELKAKEKETANEDGKGEVENEGEEKTDEK